MQLSIFILGLAGFLPKVYEGVLPVANAVPAPLHLATVQTCVVDGGWSRKVVVWLCPPGQIGQFDLLHLVCVVQLKRERILILIIMILLMIALTREVTRLSWSSAT